MTLVLTKLKTQVLNQLTVGEIICDELIPKEHILWEIHEAEEWWDNKLSGKENEMKAIDKYNGNGALRQSDDDDVELLSDDGANDNNNGVHGFTATHIANQIHEDDPGEVQQN